MIFLGALRIWLRLSRLRDGLNEREWVFKGTRIGVLGSFRENPGRLK